MGEEKEGCGSSRMQVLQHTIYSKFRVGQVREKPCGDDEVKGAI
ncbi:MAG: hypothetical protein V3R51_07320 [Gammaproteobacteria bacterium]